MYYVFSAANQALLAAGKLVQATNAAGQLLPILRDPVTGQFVELAKLVTRDHFPINALLAANPIIGVSSSLGQLGMTGIHMYQTHRGFQAVLKQLDLIKATLGVLQATTAVIGVGVAAGVVLSAINLRQTLKLREDVKQLRLEVKDGFIDLKHALKHQGVEIIQQIDEVAQDIKFEQHRLEFIKAYGRFVEATKLVKMAMSMEDIGSRNIELSNARQTLSEAVAIYNNPHLLSETSAAGQLRRLECAWAIEQAIALTYQLQNEPKAFSDRLNHLQTKIRQDSLNVIERCETEEELDFLFPEIKRIHDHDLAVLNLWQTQVDWVRSLPPSEVKLLQNSDFNLEEINQTDTLSSNELDELPEVVFYDNLKVKSHPNSLADQLRFMMQPALRREAETYISQQATATGYKTLVTENLQQASDLTVANLYWYFQLRDNSHEAEEQIEVTA